jgi:hypothetical protein
LLNEILQHSEVGPQLLATSDLDTIWMAIRGIGFAKYKEAALFWFGVWGTSITGSELMQHEPSVKSDIDQPSHHWSSLLRREKDGGVIEQSSLALQWLQAKEAIPELKRAASHHSSQTRCWVLQAISKLGTEGDLAFLANSLYDSELPVRICAAQAIEIITGEDFGFPKQSGPMDPSPPIQAARQCHCWAAIGIS